MATQAWHSLVAAVDGGQTGKRSEARAGKKRKQEVKYGTTATKTTEEQQQKDC